MNSLNNMQQDFMGWLLQQQPDIESDIEETTRVSKKTRLDIYAQAYRLRLLEALQDSFPALHTLLGDERFEALAFDYIATHPSHHFSIRYFGHELASFLSSSDNYTDNTLLSEMAEFEWAIRNAFDAADQQPASIETLINIPPEQWATLTFRFHPSTQRIDLQWDAPKLWQAIEEDSSPIQPTQNNYPIPWLIWRHGLTTHYRSLDVDEAWAIDAALHQAGFAAICEGLCEWIDEMYAAERAAGFMARWIREGLIVSTNDNT